jgi:hypothetical protein
MLFGDVAFFKKNKAPTGTAEGVPHAIRVATQKV